MYRVICVLIFCSVASAQTIIYRAVVYDAVVNWPFTTYTKIYVVFPPEADVSPAKNNTNFRNNVMTQDVIDGVTVPVPWNQVETTAPSTTQCSPVGTDLCQVDAAAPSYYHTYDWTAMGTSIDGTGCTDYGVSGPYSSSQWFCFTYGNGRPKKVNFELFGITQSSANGYTPSYVTGIVSGSTTWASATGSATQDVANTVNGSGCGGYSGQTSVPVGTTVVSNGTGNITVTWGGIAAPPFVNNDTIWLVDTAMQLASDVQVTSQYGALVSGVTGPPYSFTYTLPYGDTAATGNYTISNNATVTMVNAVQSWPVPYETPYASAYEAFLRAAIYHFNNLSISSQQTAANVGYIRVGVGAGGEAGVICLSKLSGWGIFPSYPAPTTWTNWYATLNSVVQAANPRMQIMFSINAGDPAAFNAEYATNEAAIAVSYSNAIGGYNGFGSQGLQSADIGFSVNACPGGTGVPSTANNWGCMFTKYWSGATMANVGTGMTASPTTVPLELQTAECSNPTTIAGTNTCYTGGTGVVGSLGPSLLSFANSNHVAIIELYNQDALLAFDPNYCDNASMSCSHSSGYDWFVPTLSAGTQYNFYTDVGQGSSCGAGTGTGNCDYAGYITSAHGFH
jgi:hypothetical protein